ncbi:MAG: RNA polymerase sigma factor [Sciscionella sp.]
MTTNPPFESVVARYGPTVLQVCMAVLGPDDADDAWAHTFLSALESYRDLTENGNIEAWLVTIAHRKVSELACHPSSREEPVGHGYDSVLPWADVRNLDLLSAMATLQPAHRHVLAYHYIAGLPYADIAIIMGGSLEATRQAAAEGIVILFRNYPQPPIGGSAFSDTPGGAR